MLYVDAGAWALTDFLFRTRIVEEIKSEERDVEIEDGKTLTSVFLHWQMSASSAEVSSLIRQLGRMYFQIYFSFQTSSTRSFCIYLFFFTYTLPRKLMGTFKFVVFPTFNKSVAVLTQRGRDFFSLLFGRTCACCSAEATFFRRSLDCRCWQASVELFWY